MRLGVSHTAVEMVGQSLFFADEELCGLAVDNFDSLRSRVVDDVDQVELLA